MLIPPFTLLDLSQFHAESVIVHPDLEELDVTSHHRWPGGERRGKRIFLKGQEKAIVSQTNTGPVSKATLRKLLRDGMERVWAFPSA